MSLLSTSLTTAVKISEYLEARTSCRADDSTGSYTVDPGEKSPLIKRTCRAIVSAFWSEDAKKLTSILLDWAKHTDEKQVRDALSGLLLKCGRGRDATYLRKLLSDFFVALPDPWRTSTSAIFGAQPEQYHSP